MTETNDKRSNNGKVIVREKKIVHEMIHLYCKKKHHQQDLCEECQSLSDYAMKRLSHCPYGDGKPACANCNIHCYASDYREKIKKVMRYAGPWMLLFHPIESIRHLPIPDKFRKFR